MPTDADRYARLSRAAALRGDRHSAAIYARQARAYAHWTAYDGPRGGHGWKNESGTVVYGDMPGERGTGDDGPRGAHPSRTSGPAPGVKSGAKADAPPLSDEAPAGGGPHALSPKAAATDAATRERAGRLYKNFKRKYLAKNGTFGPDGQLKSVCLNTDEWRDLFHEYRGTNSAAVHEASSALNKKLFAEALVAMKGKGNGKLVVLAGGGGSGKGTAVGDFFDESDYPIRLDQVSDDYKKLNQKLDEARAAGFEPAYTFIDRHPKDAWAGVVGRAVRAREKGRPARTVPLKTALKANLAARAVAIQVLKNRLDIEPAVIDNNHGFGKTRLITDRAAAIAYLESQNHDEAKLFQELEDDTLRLHESGEIPADIAEGLVGKAAVHDRRLQPRPDADAAAPLRHDRRGHAADRGTRGQGRGAAGAAAGDERGRGRGLTARYARLADAALASGDPASAAIYARQAAAGGD